MDVYRNPASQHPNAVTTGGQSGAGRLGGLTAGAATVCIAMIAGMFFDWAVAIMPSLVDSDDKTFVVFMQQSILTVNNSPLFLLSLMGGFVFTVWAAVLQHRVGARAAVRWIIAAFLLFLVAVMITGIAHFPLNDTIVNAGDPNQIDLAALRAQVEGPWTTAHLARTAAAVGALVCMCAALWSRKTTK